MITKKSEKPTRRSPSESDGWHPGDENDALSTRFEKIVRLFPENIAIQTEDSQYTYQQLNNSANRLAMAILDRCGPGAEPIVILSNHDAKTLLAMLSILKTGKFYVPLDPFSPMPRNITICEDVSPSLIITNDAHIEKANQFGRNLLNIDELDLSGRANDLNLDILPGSYLNIIYTSGSTGEPKGVIQIQSNIMFDTKITSSTFNYSSKDRFGLVMPFTFGASVADILGGLLNGATVIPFNVRSKGLEKMASWFKEQKITVTHMVPTIFRQWMNLLEKSDRYPHMRVIKLGGETLLKSDLDSFKGHFSSQCLLRNGLGTTETYLIAEYLMDRNTTLDGAVIPIGKATPGREILILDENRNSVNSGEIGEIAVKSRYLFPGYWQNPETTSSVLYADPEGGDKRIYLMGDLGRVGQDGNIEHLGRKDDMIKIRGQRVDLGEIEFALLDIEGITNATVTSLSNSEGSNRLVAYLISNLEKPPGKAHLRELLSKRLPSHMIPSHFMYLENFPLLPFGKINRKALPHPDWDNLDRENPYQPPRDAVERELTQIWLDSLNLQKHSKEIKIGINDNFFELGGDSLSATELTLSIEDHFQIELPSQIIYEKATIAELASLINELRQGGQKDAIAADDEDLKSALNLLEKF
jgi:amino acid adenylation domain-containing protein